MTISAINLGETHPDGWIHLLSAMAKDDNISGETHPDMVGFTYFLE
jgi:hypothetical protein